MQMDNFKKIREVVIGEDDFIILKKITGVDD